MLTKLKKIYRVLSRTERAAFAASVAIAAVTSVILAGTVIGKVTKAVAARGGSYSEGVVGQPSFVNPVIASNDADKSLVRLLFSNVMDLSEKVEPEGEGRVWVLRLKENLAWHDGEELTSDDVLFTVRKIQDPDSRSPLFESWQGVRLERVSSREVRFNLGNPYVFFASNLKNLYVLPKHLYEHIPVANWRISEFNLKPVGSGPYVFDSYDTRPDGFITEYRIKPNGEYFDARPFISNITFRFYQNKDELIHAFNGGRIDGLAGIEMRELEQIGRPYGVEYFQLPNYYAVFFNQNQNIALKEREVRRALAAAVDRQKLVAEIFKGRAAVVTGPIPHDTDLARATIHASPASADAANEILEDAKWARGETGIRETRVRNSAIHLELTLTVPDVPFLVRTAEYLKSAWEEIGAAIHINLVPLEEVADPIIKNREYQMILFGNILNAGSDLYSFWHSSERFHPGLNLSLYHNDKVDGLIESIRQNFDVERAESLYRELQERIVEDFPAIFLYSPDYLYVTGKELKGMSPRLITEPADRFSNIADWHLKTKRVLK
ncbi:MAG: peptide ABC transporter substrate-binding protein [Candidatus Liptonbacteria bacterium]|nr:peptide ABC transporter substrate-binding protein [Candidatus Liptonbacteria bacterium]